MAVLAPQDWHPPKDHAMDSPSSNGSNSAVPRQHSGNTNTNSAPGPPSLHIQQPYPYPVPQQQAGWTPNHSAPPFYPAFYQNHHPHSQYAHPSHPQQAQIPPQNPYYDHAASSQFAQWAYQQMMYNAQQGHQLPQFPAHPLPHGSQRGRSGSNSTQPEYFPPNHIFNPFPSGTPPPHPANNNFPRNPSGDPQSPPQLYNGFHPYRRPNRSQNQDSSQPSTPVDWRSGAAGPFQPPYARNDASGSSTSVNSNSSQSSRHRTNSFQGSAAGHGNGSNNPQLQPNRPTPTNGTSRSSSSAPASASSTSNSAQRPHYRTVSSSSTSSNAGRSPTSSVGPSSPSSAPTTTTMAQTTPGPRPVKPSPLSQGNFTAAEKRMSRDDSDLAVMMESTSTVPGGRSGLKGRLRRALSFNAANALREEDEEEESSSKGKSSQGRPGVVVDKSQGPGDSAETATAGTKKKSRTALFNARLNASTDNISLSSTMSSASMVIRKLGNMAKLTRRNSLAGITSIFKDKKEKEEDGSGSKSKSKKKNGKGAAAEASVSHVTAELDRSEWSAELNGLSPAARLARQHTLKSNAEAAARAKAAQPPASTVQDGNNPTPTTWEKNTTSRQREVTPVNGSVTEEGTRVIVEEDDGSDSEDDKLEGSSHPQDNSGSLDGWDDTEDWGEGDEDVTIRGGVDSLNLDHEDDGDMEPWAVDVRRSLEKRRIPTKGILKTSVYTADQPFARTRSNSYNSAPPQPSELGPLARIPSSDPDHIDGLHNHASHLPAPAPNTPFLPPLAFQSTDSPKEMPDNSAISSHFEKTMFSHSNSSAPALSAMFSSNPPTLSHRSATAPAKRLAFASNLSVYDTFPPSVYDRRSEPATWSRLTPALAQRIKEELNSYKMEEMEVHASSRIHTQFFV